MTDLNKVVKVALMALTMMVGVQSASADDVTIASVATATRDNAFGFATRSSRTDASETSAYTITGGGVYNVSEIKAMMTTGGITTGGSATVDGKKIIVLRSDGSTPMDATILSAITNNDIIVFDGGGTSTDFLVNEQIALRSLSNKTLLGLNGARLCTAWHLTDIIKSWLNAVETSSGTGVSNASTAAGTGGSFWLKDVNGVDSIKITIDEEGEWLTRMTLADKGSELYQKWLADKAAAIKDGTEVPAMPENARFLRTEYYKKSGVFYIEGCSNFVIRNLSFVGPGSVDVGGVDLVSVINGCHHIWVDHCEFIDGQDGNFDITNYSDYITTSWCHFHYTGNSYVHQNTNLVGSGNDKANDESATGDKGKLNITFAYNEWGEKCRSRMPMGRAGKIHMLNNWYNCAGNTEYAINPRINSEFLIEGNYFAEGVTKTFQAKDAIAVTISGNTVADATATQLAASGSSTVTVPYDYKNIKIAASKVPEMVNLFVGPVLDVLPDFDATGCVNPTNETDDPLYEAGKLKVNVKTNRAAQGLTFSVWANHVIGYQWYKATSADLSDAEAISGATDNSYTFESSTEGTTYLFCRATGLAGTDDSNTIVVTVAGTDAVPTFDPDLTDFSSDSYTAIVGSSFTDLTVNAGEGVTYQWYKNSVGSYDDATLISGATSSSYTFTPSASEQALGYQFFYCVATNSSDVTLSAKSKIARVVYKSSVDLINWEADATTPTDADKDLTGITKQGTASYASQNSLGVLKLGNSPKDNSSNGFRLDVEGFKTGDDITIAGFYSNSGEETARAKLAKSSDGETFTDLHDFGVDFVNKATDASAVPVNYTYTLQEGDLDGTDGYIYVVRQGSKSCFLTKILVTRGDPLTPYIKTDLDDETSYQATVDVAKEFTIVAEQAQSYQWYTCTSPIDYEANKTAIEGKTTATCSYTATAPGTTYLYCVITNGTGSKAKSVNSKIATVIAKANSSGTTKATYTWDPADWDSGTYAFNTAVEAGSYQSFPAKDKDGSFVTGEDGLYLHYYGGKGKSEIDAKSGSRTIEGKTWTKPLKTGADAKKGTNPWNCIFKFTAPYAGKVTIYFRGGGKVNKNVERPIYANSTLSETGAESKQTATTSDILSDILEYDITTPGDVYFWATKSTYIYGVILQLDEPGGGCAKPKETKGAWSGDASRTWTYTVSSSTETARIHYKVDGGEERVAGSNSVDIVLGLGATVDAWAVDSEGTLATSDIYTFTADTEMGKAATPTITQAGSYSVSSKGFPITMTVEEGYTIHYTTDGTDPTAESATYSETIYVAPGATVKAISTKIYYDLSAVASLTLPDFDVTGGMEQTLKANGSEKENPNTGVSYNIAGTLNAGAATGLDDGVKIRTASADLTAVSGKKGFIINVNEGFKITKIIANKIATNNTDGEMKLTGVYVDENATNLLAEEKTLPYSSSPTSFTLVENIAATSKIEIAVEANDEGVTKFNNQINALFDIYYEIADTPKSVTITGKVNGGTDYNETVLVTDERFVEKVLTINKASYKFDEAPTITLNTTNEYTYPMEGAIGENGYTRFSTESKVSTYLGAYTVNAMVNAVLAPEVSIDKDGDGLTLYRDAQGIGRVGYKVTVTPSIKGTTYIKIDGGDAVAYDSSKEYYALKTVQAYARYTEDEEVLQTGINTANCPDNNYDASKPAAILVYQSGYQDTGAGQEEGTTSAMWLASRDKDQIYLGLTDQYNVIDLVLNDDNQKKMINKTRPDIRNAQLVVLTEMIGSKSPDGNGVYSTSKLQDAIMSVRDSVISYTNVLNLKMFFYSQSTTSSTRWAWAQPATLANNIVSIVPKNSMYKVFENVSFSKDGTIALWSGIDEESTLNRLQLVHNYNEDNEDLPQFVQLATVTDEYGEEYDALHFFESKRNNKTYTYVGTGISINDCEHYDENLRLLISTIGDMINKGISLGTVLTGVPAPHIKDNGDASATITNNKPNVVTKYLTNDTATAPVEWGATEAAIASYIKTNGVATIDNITKKFSSDKYVFAISYADNGAPSDTAVALVKGTPNRYFHRLNTDSAAEGVESTVRYQYNAESIIVPYNQTFRKKGYSVTQWKVKDSNPAVYYYPGQTITDADIISEDIYLEAVWTENAHKITDTNGLTETQRTVTWNFKQSEGAPALALEYGSTKLAQQGFIVGQMKFSDAADGNHIDVVLDIDVDNTETLPGESAVYNGKFNNKQNSFTDPTKYVKEFAQVRTGTKFTFPSVWGMDVKFVQADFEKFDGDGKRECDKTYVTQSIIVSGTDTTAVSNPGLEIDSTTGAIKVNGSGIANVVNDNLAAGGLFNYHGTDTLATLITKECAVYATPSAEISSKTVGALNKGTAFMDKLTVVYPELFDIAKVVNLPEGHINILPQYKGKTDAELTEEELAYVKSRAATMTLSDARKNSDGRYAVGDSISINVVPGYSLYFNTTPPVNLEEDAPLGVVMTGLAEGTGTSVMSLKAKEASGKFKITATPTVTINLKQNAVYEYNVSWEEANWGTVRLSSRTGKNTEEEFTAFPADSTITITPVAKIGYQLDKWVDSNGNEYVSGEPGSKQVRFPTGVTKGANNDVLTVVVSEGNSGNNNEYHAVFKTANIGTTYYELPSAGLYKSATSYEPFGEPLAPGDVTDNMYRNYHFPRSYETSALYVPIAYTLYKPGYTLKNWVWIEGFNILEPEEYYEDQSKVHEYQIGEYHYFDNPGDTRYIIPIFKQNVTDNQDASEKVFDYRTTTADITWDFRTANFAQHLNFPTTTEFDYATYATINGGTVIDVPLHIKGKVDNTTLDEWCHFDEGTEITIPSGLGAKFTLATYYKLSSTTIDGVVPLEYTKGTDNDIPVYYYTYTTQNPATSIKLVIGKDHTYYKYIRAQLPSADKVTLTTETNNSAWGSNVLVKANTASTMDGTEVKYTQVNNENTMPLGSYVQVKATRKRLYELKSFVVNGDTIPATVAGAAAKGYTLTVPSGTDKDYTLTFRLASYTTTVEAVFGTRTKYQVTFASGGKAYGEAPGVQVAEAGETFTMPAKNQTLYMEGYTLKYWMDENGIVAVNADGSSTGENKYEWGKVYAVKDNLYLTPVFEINEFTLFNLPSGWHAVTWPLATGDDPTYGGAPTLKYQKSSGVYVSQLTVGGLYIDMPLNINCAETGKVDNSATDYRCQINSGTVMSFLTSQKCRISLYTSNGELTSTKIAGTKSYTSNKVSGTVNDQYAIVPYSDKDATQDIQFTGDATYFKLVKVEYGQVKNDNLPELKQVTINNIALGSYGSPYKDYMLSKLKTDKVMTVDLELSSKALSMPTVEAKADKSDAVVTVTQATFDDPTSTIIVKTKEGATVAVYKLDFNVTFNLDIEPPQLQKIEMNGILVKAKNNSGDFEEYNTNQLMSINGAINVTFDHEMAATDTLKTTGLGQPVVSAMGKTLTFTYWGLTPNTPYTFTILANTLKDVYNGKYEGSDLTFSFTTEASETVEKKKINFVVTHKQTHSFNTDSPTENYTSTIKRQVASNELIANLDAAGIAHGTIDEGIALANASVGKDRYYIFVPDGEYQLRGNKATDPISSAPYDGNGKVRNELTSSKTAGGAGIYNGVTAITKNNVSITGQSQSGSKLWNKPEIEGISYTSTFMVNSGVSGFYMQDMTLTNKFDYKSCIGGGSSAARAVVLRDRGSKTIMKNVTMDSWQDTYYSNVSNKENDTRGYFENCTFMGYVDFFCGDGDNWFERCNLILRNGKTGNASNMVAPSTYDNQQWGYVFNNCQVNVEDDATYSTCNNKFTLARPWKNSPAATFLDTKFNVLPSEDGYKQMTTGGLVLRMHEYGSVDANDALLDLSTRSLRASSPGAGSYSAVMTPAEAATYTLHNALSGSDGYDPQNYTKQVSMADAKLTTLDRSLTWNEKESALCYFIFRKNDSDAWKLYAVTEENSYELTDDQIGETFMVRAANLRGGLGEPSNELVYSVHESYQLELVESQKAPVVSGGENYYWSTIYLDYNAKAPTKADNVDGAEVNVYAVVGVTDNSMTLKSVDILEKDQGYIVRGTKAGLYTFAYTDSEGEYVDGTKVVAGTMAASEGRLSILDGTVETEDRAGRNVYTLYYKSNYGLGFYNYTGEYLNANRAYLSGDYVKGEGVPIVGQNSVGFIFLDDLIPTDIGNVNGNDSDNSERIYTVYGQRVKRSEMIKGRVYIVNGRKIAYQ